MTSFLDKLGHITQLIITVAVMGAFFGTIYLLMTLQVDLHQGVREVLLVLVGVLAGAFKDCVGYFLGSSLGSAKKDAKNAGPTA